MYALQMKSFQKFSKACAAPGLRGGLEFGNNFQPAIDAPPVRTSLTAQRRILFSREFHYIGHFHV